MLFSRHGKNKFYYAHLARRKSLKKSLKGARNKF